MTAVNSTPAFSQPRIVEKAFGLPIVSDAYLYGVVTVSSLTSSLLSSPLASLPPVVSSQLASLKSLGHERLPEVVFTSLGSARDQAAASVQSLDTTLCSGLDQLVDKVPSLATPSPALYSSTREAAVSHLSQATTYLASFTLAQLALKASDSGLETAESLLKLVPVSYSSQCEPLVSGLKRVRQEAATVRREGATRNGSQKVAAMEDSSLLSAMTEVLSLHHIFSVFGLSGVIVKTEASEADTAEEDLAVEMVKVLKDVTAAKVAREEITESAGTASGVVEEVPEVKRKGNKN